MKDGKSARAERLLSALRTQRKAASLSPSVEVTDSVMKAIRQQAARASNEDLLERPVWLAAGLGSAIAVICFLSIDFRPASPVELGVSLMLGEGIESTEMF